MSKVILLIFLVLSFDLHAAQKEIGVFDIKLDDSEFSSFFHASIRRQLNAIFPEEIDARAKYFNKDSLNNIFYIGNSMGVKHIILLEVDRPVQRCSYSCFMPFFKSGVEEMTTYVNVYSVEHRQRVFEGEIFTRASTKSYFITEGCDRLHRRAGERAKLRENNYTSTVEQIKGLLNDIGIK